MDEGPLAALPTFLAGVGAGLVAATDTLGWHSLAAAAAGGAVRSVHGGYAVSALTIGTHVSLIARDSGRILFLPRRTGLPQITMQADVDVRLVPAALGHPARAPTDTTVKLHLPGLILRSASAAQYRQFTHLTNQRASAPPSAHNTLLLATPDGVLACYNGTPDTLRDDAAQLQFNPNGGAPVLIRNQSSATLLLGVFLNLLEVLRQWSRDELPDAVSVHPPTALQGASDVMRTLATLVQAHAQFAAAATRRGTGAALAALRAHEPAATITEIDRTVLAWAQHFVDFQVGGFTANLGLRLDRTGNFARSNRDDPFQVAIRADIVDRANAGGGTTRELHLHVRVPDFLGSADETRRFLRPVIEDAEVVRAIARRLGAARPAARTFLRATQDHAIVFRLRRRVRRGRRIDDDMIVWRGWFHGQSVVVILWVRLRIDGDVIDVRRFRVDHAGAADATDRRLGDELVDYLQKVATLLQRWAGIGAGPERPR